MEPKPGAAVKRPGQGSGWVDIRRRGLVKSIRWPDLPNELRYMVSSEMTRQVKQPTKFQNNQIVRFGSGQEWMGCSK